MILKRLIPLLVCAAVTWVFLGSNACAEEKKKPNRLPFYYQFFMKTGAMESIKEEKERDAQIESGAIAPIHVGKPVKDFRLPDGFGNVVGLRDYVGKKNVVLTTMRTWW